MPPFHQEFSLSWSYKNWLLCCSVPKSCPTLRAHGLRHASLLCASLCPEVCSNSCPLSWSCYLPSYSLPPPLLLPSVFLSISVFSNELAFPTMWPKYWSLGFSNSPSDEYSGLISFRIDWCDLLAVQETLKSLLQHHNLKASVLWCSVFFGFPAGWLPW